MKSQDGIIEDLRSPAVTRRQCDDADSAMNTLDAAIAALEDMIALSESWASCGPEGFTREEKRRVREAEKALIKLRRLKRAL